MRDFISAYLWNRRYGWEVGMEHAGYSRGIFKLGRDLRKIEKEMRRYL
jgi:hypothetical protein